MVKRGFKAKLLSVLITLMVVVSTVSGLAGGRVSAEELPTPESDGESSSLWEPVDDAAPVLTSREVTDPEAFNENYVTADGMVRVTIILNDEPTIDRYPDDDLASDRSAVRYRSRLQGKQQTVADRISSQVLQGADLDVVWNLTLVGNAISAYVPADSIDAIRQVSGVADVVYEACYSAMDEPSSDQPTQYVATGMTGAAQVWNSGYTGAGTRIAIIDTGLDTDHQSFSADAFRYAIAQTGKSVDLMNVSDIAAVWSQLNFAQQNSTITAADAFLTEKVPFALNYVDGDRDVTHDNDTQGEHGSHVAGIAAANRYIKQNGSYVPALDAVLTQGEAPDAQLLIMKVFGKGGGAYDSDYMAAIEDAILLGADSCNLSLGSANAGMVTSSYYQDILDSLTSSSTVVTMSSGNSYNWATYTAYGYLYSDDHNLSTAGSPSTYANSLAVASVENDGFIGKYLEVAGQKMFYTETSGYGNPPISSIAGSYSFVYVDSVGSAEEFAAVAGELAGKVAICNRGITSFYQKANAAVANGAVAVIVANNEAGTFSMNLTGYTGDKPVVSITQADGAVIKANAASSATASTASGSTFTYYEGTITISDQVSVATYDSDYLTMNDFSSWGVPGDLTLKPEITAPGGDIYSVNGAVAGGTAYENMSGTSMAAPQVAGIAALVSQYIKENGLTQSTGKTVRQLTQSLLMSTAIPLVEEGSGCYYSILDQGAGLVNADQAVSAKSYIMMDASATASAADGKVKAELGDDPSRAGHYQVTFTLNNLTDEAVAFDPDAAFFTQDVFTQSQSGLSFLDTWTTLIDSTVVWTVDGQPLVTAADLLNYDFDGDGGFDAAKDARYLLRYVNGKIPDQQMHHLDSADLNGDGRINSRDVYLTLTASANAVIPADGSVSVTADIRLSMDDRLDNEGNYIEGYLFVQEDGGVEHSIPVLGYYGSWTESSMYDRGTAIDAYYGTGDYENPYTAPYSYAGLEDDSFDLQGFLWQPSGSSSKYAFGGNPFVWDETYHPERNALNSQDSIAALRYTQIRNSAGWRFTVLDAAGNEMPEFTKQGGADYAAYYYVNGRSWQHLQTNTNLNWSPEGLAEGTRVTLQFALAPEYYVSADGSINWSALASGAKFSIPLVIDNTDPQIEDIELIYGEDGTTLTGLNVTAQDNQYVAAVVLYNGDSGDLIDDSLVLGAYEDAEAGEARDYELSFTALPDGTTLPDHLLLQVYDYASNHATYKINLKTEELSDEVAVSIDQDSAMVLVGAETQLTATVTPFGIQPDTVTWSSSDESKATVDANGVVTGVAEGSADITATSVKDPTKSDTLTVSVIVIRDDLNAVIWDEHGEVWFSSFNTETLPAYQKLTTESCSQPIVSVAVDTDGTTYAASLDTQTGASVLYKVGADHSLTEIGAVGAGAYDLAISPSNGNYLVAVYGQFILLIDKTTGGYDGGFKDDAFASDPLVGVAYVGTDHNSFYDADFDMYYMVTQSGALYATGVITVGSNVGWFGAQEAGAMGHTTDDDHFNSLYYNGSYLYWSAIQESSDYVELYAADINNTCIVADLGRFGDSVWPVGGLYEAGHAALANGGAVPALAQTLEQSEAVEAAQDLIPAPEGGDGPAEPAPEAEETLPQPAQEPVKQPDEEAVEPAQPREEAAVSGAEPPVEEPVGQPQEEDAAALAGRPQTGLIRFGSDMTIGSDHTSYAAWVVAHHDVHPNQGVVVLAADPSAETVHNGQYLVTYDPDKVSYTGFTPVAPFDSTTDMLEVNEAEPGTIRVDFATRDGVEAGKAVVQLGFAMKNGADGEVIHEESVVVAVTQLINAADLDQREHYTLGNYQQTVSLSNNPGGTIAPAGEVKVDRNDELVVTLTPDQGYVVGSILVNGQETAVPADGRLVLKVSQDMTVQVVFTQVPDTGDHSHLEAWVGLMVLMSLCALGTYLLRRKTA